MKLFGFAASFCWLVGLAGVAWAQVDSQTAVEGYVFDASHKPLANVIVTLRSASPNDPNLGVSVAVVTNANGFFQLATAIDPASVNSLEADCKTSKAIVASTMPLYTPARPTVYRRDFFLTLPKRAKGCVLP
jgi:hypothetical protein